MFMKGFAPSFVFGAQMAKRHILPTRHLHSVMMDRVWLSLIRWGKTHTPLSELWGFCSYLHVNICSSDMGIFKDHLTLEELVILSTYHVKEHHY